MNKSEKDAAIEIAAEGIWNAQNKRLSEALSATHQKQHPLEKWSHVSGGVRATILSRATDCIDALTKGGYEIKAKSSE